MFFSYEKCRIILDNSDDYMTLNHPLLINWNINGKCQNSCIYCFANDYIFMEDIVYESEINNIIDSIKKLTPLVVVISGGEPLLYSKLKFLLNKLVQFCNVVIDTNGLCLDEDFILYCKNNKILIRVSLDDYRGYINDNIRLSSIKNSTDIILKKIYMLLELDANFIIHTVLSNNNMESIIEFAKTLLFMQIKFWEIQVVIPYNDDKEKLHKKINEIEEFFEKSKNKITIKIHNNYDDEKCIILINPRGEFLTRKTNSLKKEFIDCNNINNPKLDVLMSVLDIKNHFKRYTDNII